MSDILIDGVRRFRRRHFRRQRTTYSRLARDGQSPHTLFITCADSRILPHALTQADPGELFVLRNVGNMVPAHDAPQACASTGAAIEYAVGVLGVTQIVVCGHSQCGACAALYQMPAAASAPHTRRWLEQGQPVRELVLAQSGLAEADLTQAMQSLTQREALLRATERAMVVRHLANLERYPQVAEGVARGTLAVQGWYFQLERGEVERYDPRRLAFVALDTPRP